MSGLTGERAWRGAMQRILKEGQLISPRGLVTYEILHTGCIQVDLARAVVTSPKRKLSYKFMAAEALWILDGRNDLAPLVKHAPSFAKYSDDGLTLFGAYGPRIVPQLGYIIGKLLDDRDTRQAVLTTWDRTPPETKDVPCTIAMSFNIRNGYLNQHVFMRSSDAWLGIPYDMFSFSCIGIYLACEYNTHRNERPPVLLGTLTISPTSSHLYASNLDAVRAVLAEPIAAPIGPVPPELVFDGRAGWKQIRADLERVELGERPVNWKLTP